MRLQVIYYFNDISIVQQEGVASPDEYGAFLATNLPSGEGSALDLTTGSGFHAIVLNRLGFTVTAVDINSVATKSAQSNAAANGAKLTVLTGDLYGPVVGQRFDVIVAWPPIMPNSAADLSHSNHKQINDGGAEGFDVLEKVLIGSGRALAPGGRLFTVRPWYLDKEKFDTLVVRSGMQCRTLATERFPLGTLSTERLAYLCSISGHEEEDLRSNGQEMHVVELKTRPEGIDEWQ